uniref:RNase H type-1 domain-containing protein n=1 Tax=Fagus sylvatica TaxID=28930 RepID=A0A2N9EP87_FAGSY
MRGRLGWKLFKEEAKEVDVSVVAERIGQDHVWMPPGEGFVKVNWDVACNSQSHSWHMGVLIRDHGGQAMGAMCGPVMSLPSGVHPKIGACIQALSFALDMGFTAMVFEGPSVPFLHNLFARPVATRIEDMWLEEVQNLVQRCGHFIVSLGSVTSNLAVRELVHRGFSNTCSIVWVEEAPVEIRCVL